MCNYIMKDMHGIIPDRDTAGARALLIWMISISSFGRVIGYVWAGRWTHVLRLHLVVRKFSTILVTSNVRIYVWSIKCS